jgi:hypothetical protein
MENKQAVAVAVGVGAVGTALAYLGYSVYNKNEDISNLTDDVSNLTGEETKPWWSNLWTNSNTEPSMYNEVDEVDEVDETVQLKEALKEEKNVKIEKKDPKVWQSFWKGEYDDAKKKDEE